MRKLGELCAFALQGIFDLQRILENAVFIPLRQWNQWGQLKGQLKAYSPVFDTLIPATNRSLNLITSTMRFILSNLNDYSTKLRKLFADVTAASTFTAEDFQRFQEDIEYSKQDISFFCDRIEVKAARVTPLLEKIEHFEEQLSRQQNLLGNIHNELFLNPPEKIRWVSDPGKCEFSGRNQAAHIIITSTRIILLSCHERRIILEFEPNDIEEIIIRRKLLGRKRCLIKTDKINIKFSKTSSDLHILKKRLENGLDDRTTEDSRSSQDFFDPDWFVDRYHEKIRILLKLTPGDTGRWKAVLVDALRKVSTYVKRKKHDLAVIKRTYQRTLYELVKADNSAHLAGYENRLQEIDEELAELGGLHDILTDAFSQIDNEIAKLDDVEKDELLNDNSHFEYQSENYAESDEETF
ncbi:MAG: hypothetical protein ACFFGZ_03170 [Candidatus Thorarchaeota archaeon]